MKNVVPLHMAGNRDELGFGPKRISQSGCLLTDIAMAVNYYGRDHGANWTVSALDKYLEKKKLFTGSGLLVADALHALGLTASRGVLDIGKVRRHLATDLIIVGIDYRPGHSSAYSPADHFVLLTDYHEDQDAYAGIDPILGMRVTYRGNPLALYPSLEVPWVACEAIHLSVKDPEKMRTP